MHCACCNEHWFFCQYSTINHLVHVIFFISRIRIWWSAIKLFMSRINLEFLVISAQFIVRCWWPHSPRLRHNRAGLRQRFRCHSRLQEREPAFPQQASQEGEKCKNMPDLYLVLNSKGVINRFRCSESKVKLFAMSHSALNWPKKCLSEIILTLVDYK